MKDVFEFIVYKFLQFLHAWMMPISLFMGISSVVYLGLRDYSSAFCFFCWSFAFFVIDELFEEIEG